MGSSTGAVLLPAAQNVRGPCSNTCTLERGTVVVAPWNGQNEGTESCKRFSCIGSPTSSTGAVLLPAAQNVRGPCSNTCTLEGGTVVVAPWTGRNEGTESCKTFACIGTPTGAQLLSATQ